MILVADSGSSKCAWRLASADGNIIYSIETIGLNPLFLRSDQMVERIVKTETLSNHSELITQVYFYGASCATPDLKDVVEAALMQCFPQAEIQVEHDLLGAVRATCGSEEGITCILGTGSNACYFDGLQIHQPTPSLGFILGDEGSGSYLGKQLLRDYFYKLLPQALHKDFDKKYAIDLERMIQSVYSESSPNRFLASFVPFLSAHSNSPYVHELVRSSFARFSSLYIWPIEQFRSTPIHFIGSVAFYFSDILEEVALNHRFTVAKVLQQPVDTLVAYHSN